MRVPVPPDEARRLQLLAELGLLDTTQDPAFDEIVRLAAAVCGTPISLVSFIDADRQVFKARLGLSVSGTARCVSLCTHVICRRELMVISDTLTDERVRGHPILTAEPLIRFYAGAPIVYDGVALGTVCVADLVPRVLPGMHATMLMNLAERAARHLAKIAAEGVTRPAGQIRPVGWVA